MGEDSAQDSMAAVSVPAKQEQIGVWSLTKTQVAPAGPQSSLSHCTEHTTADTQGEMSTDLCKMRKIDTVSQLRRLSNLALPSSHGPNACCMLFDIYNYILHFVVVCSNENRN